MAGVRLPSVSGKRVIRALIKAGFVEDRIVGSHHVMVRAGRDSRAVTVPVHGNRDLKPARCAASFAKRD